MNVYRKLLIFLFSLLITHYSLLTPALAVSEFETSYFINYQVSNSGETQTTQEVKLRNRLKNVYATQYNLNIDSTEINDIKAWDKQNNLDTKVENLDNSTNIIVFLKQKVLGKNKEQNFFLSYKTSDFAFVKGKVLEVGIPLLSKLEEVDTYQVNLLTPLQFSQATSILPNPTSQKQQKNHYVYSFNKQVLNKAEGIRATFGQTQFFKFNLKYHLKNPGSIPVEVQITLPPDTPFQKLSYQKITPLPKNVEIDSDGNWLASYRLEDYQEKTIIAEGLAQIFLTSRKEIIQTPNFSPKDYLIKQPFWETDEDKVKKLAERLKTPKAIYNYLINNFIYDYGRAASQPVERLGAKKALENPANAICMEFTDTFVALARAIGIPAREVNGFAYTANPKLRPLSLERDVLHAWPEYWDAQKKAWIPIDPTWGNTTGGLDFFHKRDLDHFAFVFHGLSSEEPMPAGSFKLANSTKKDINIEFADEFSEQLKSEIQLITPRKITGGTINSAKVIIKNTGTSALYQKPVKIYLEKEGKKVWGSEQQIEILPPFAEEKIELKLSVPFFIEEAALNLITEFDEQKTDKKIIIQPLISLKVISWGTGGALGCLFGLTIIKISYALTKRK